MTRHRVLLVTVAALAGAAAAVAQQVPAAPQPNFDSVMMRAVRVRPNVWMIAGAGGNTTIQFGDQGVLVVDTTAGGAADCCSCGGA